MQQPAAKDVDQINQRFEHDNIHRKTDELKTVMEQIPDAINALGAIMCDVYLTKAFTFTNFARVEKIIVNLQDQINSVYRQHRMIMIQNISIKALRFLEKNPAEYSALCQTEDISCIVFEVERLWNSTINAALKCTNAEFQRNCLTDMRKRIATIRSETFKRFQREIDDLINATAAGKKRGPPDDQMMMALSQRPRLLEGDPVLPPMQTTGFQPAAQGTASPFRPQPIRPSNPMQANEMELIGRCYNFLKATRFWSNDETHVPPPTYTALESVLIVTHTRSRIIAARNDPNLDTIVLTGLPLLFPESQPERMVQVTSFQLKKFQEDVNALCSRLLIHP